MRKISKVYIPSDEEFIKIVKNNICYSDILRALELSTKGGSSTKILKKRINELNIDISHFGKINSKATQKIRQDLKTILVENSTYKNIARLKIRLVNEGYLTYECSICKNIGLWNEQPLSLQLDHINGINTDHRIENLRFLCPNCHSQTHNYAGKNIGVEG